MVRRFGAEGGLATLLVSEPNHVWARACALSRGQLVRLREVGAPHASPQGSSPFTQPPHAE